MLFQKEVDNSLAKEAYLQQKIEGLDSFIFEFAEEVRDANRKKRYSHNHAKHFKQLAHRRLKRSKELLNIGIPAKAIHSSIYTLYETLTGVDPTEVPSVSFIRGCRTVVKVVVETIAAWKLSDAGSWRQIFTDATSRRQCAFQALVVRLINEYGFLDPVIVSSCIFLENETSLTTFDTIVDKLSIFLMFVFHFHKQLLTAYFISLISYFQTTDKLFYGSSKEIEISCCFQAPKLP